MGKVSCCYCLRIHDRNYICNAKKKRQLEKSKRDRERLDSKIYSTTRWRKIRDIVIEDYNNIDLFSYYVLGRVEIADCVHHISEILGDNDRAYDTDNLIPLSNYNHRHIVHKLYNTKCKNDIQDMLYNILEDWNKDNRELGSYKERYNNIVKDFGINI